MNSSVLAISQYDIIKCCDNMKKRYSVWVYENKDGVKVYDQQKPNTEQVWFQFNEFSHLYWKMLEDYAVVQQNGKYFYNFNNVKLFMIKYLFSNTNLPQIKFERNNDGSLTQESLEKVMKIHPRILRAIMDNLDIFPQEMTRQEDRELKRQCMQLFGKGQAVNNPNKWVTIYCNLTSFWDKFGLNLYDIMKLPRDSYLMLHKIMMLEIDSKNKEMERQSNKSKGR